MKVSYNQTPIVTNHIQYVYYVLNKHNGHELPLCFCIVATGFAIQQFII
jgi:hypothetical protein